VEELPSPVVQRRSPDEASFRKSFRHVNNVSDPASFFVHSRRNPYSHPRNLYSEFIGTPYSHRPESAARKAFEDVHARFSAEHDAHGSVTRMSTIWSQIDTLAIVQILRDRF